MSDYAALNFPSAILDDEDKRYHWLNFHPKSEWSAVQDWFLQSQNIFNENGQIHPLVLQGDAGVGRSYLLDASFYTFKPDHLPVHVIHWDLEEREAKTYKTQYEHIKAQTEDLENKLQQQNAGLWKELQTFLGGITLESDNIDSMGGLVLSTTLGSFKFLSKLPQLFTTKIKQVEAPFYIDQLIELLAALLQERHLVLHVKHAEQMDIALPQTLRTILRRLNEKADIPGTIHLAYSTPPNFPLTDKLGQRDHYQPLLLQPISRFSLKQAITETYGEPIASKDFIDTLMIFAGFEGQYMEPTSLANIMNYLLEKNLLQHQNGVWQFTTDNLDEFIDKSIGGKLEVHWHERFKQIPAHLQDTLNNILQLAALGGEWIPIDVLLDYLQIHNGDQRDEIIDVLDDVFEDTQPPLLHCMQFYFVSFNTEAPQDKQLVYRFAISLLPKVILKETSPKQRENWATDYLSWLEKYWQQADRNQATYLLRLANHAPLAVREKWHEKLAWWVEIEAVEDLKQQVYRQLQQHLLTPRDLLKIMSHHYTIWPAPKQFAICQAWLNFYKQNSQSINQKNYSGKEWHKLWEQAVIETPIPSHKEGIALCHFLGRLKRTFGELIEAEQLFHLGIELNKNVSDIMLEAHLHREIAHIDIERRKLEHAEVRLRHEVLPRYKQLRTMPSALQSEAATMGLIADILTKRGQLEKAQDILEEILPTFEKLNDDLSIANTMCHIAEIQKSRTQLDESLETLENALLISEKLGDARSKAVTLGLIADVLQSRGQFNEALNIRENEELPVFNQLGNIREKAITMEKIADILQAQGKPDDTLRILEETLPIYEKLGDAQSKNRTVSKIADTLKYMNN